jgi:hypothetical protein
LAADGLDASLLDRVEDRTGFGLPCGDMAGMDAASWQALRSAMESPRPRVIAMSVGEGLLGQFRQAECARRSSPAARWRR